MFQRSETLHSVKYANYIGDGDSKIFKGILDVQPYKTFTVNKKECIDHVQKRMGTRLRNFKKTTKGLGEEKQINREAYRRTFDILRTSHSSKS